MTRYLVLNSGLVRMAAVAALLLVFGVAGAKAQSPSVQQYSAYITFPKGGGISGVCVVSREANAAAMSMMNEFGIKVFDATYSAANAKVKLHNVIAPLRKFYIKRVIAQDIRCIFAPELPLPKGRVVETADDGIINLANKRYKITYNLKPIADVAE